MVRTMNPEDQAEIYSCDYTKNITSMHTLVGMKHIRQRCNRKPFAEVFEDGTWSYLCVWHFLLERLRGRKWAYGWCRSGKDD